MAPYLLPTAGALLFLFQLLTGVLLMTIYSPAAATAWGSVWYIQTQVPHGWLIRGIHHFASDVLLVVLVLWALQLIMTRAYCGIGRRGWWAALCLIGLTLALSLTGHLLPWDQEGYWGTTVRTNILARTPWVGETARRLLVGGHDLGQLTLTRFYTLHAAVLPALMGLVIWHSRTARRRLPEHRATDATTALSSAKSRAGAPALITCGAAFATVLALIALPRYVTGMELLDAPADPTTSDYPARPEWHTLFLHQWLKLFGGQISTVVGAIVVPGLIAATFVAFPFFERVLAPRGAHGLVLSVAAITGLAIVWLTAAGLLADRNPTDELVRTAQARQAGGETLSRRDESALRARQFNEQRDYARRRAQRAMALAAEHGIPPQGPLDLLANDPLMRGPELFAVHCAVCHRFNGHDGLGRVPPEPAASSDLFGYASRAWVRGLLNDPMDARYFGRMRKPDGTPAHTRMSTWLDETRQELQSREDQERLGKDFDAVAAFLESESRQTGRLANVGADDVDAAEPPPGRPKVGPADPEVATADDDEWILHGRRFFTAVCNECHSYGGERRGTVLAPEMLGYGSVPWIELMIADPAHESRYRSRGKEPAQMPAFKDRLSERERTLIAHWLHASRPVPEASTSAQP